MPRRFYLDLKAVSWRELSRILGGVHMLPLYLIARATGAFRDPEADPQTECTPFERYALDYSDLPAELRVAFDPVLAEAEKLGFTEAQAQLLPSTKKVPLMGAVALRHRERRCLLRVIYARNLAAAAGGGVVQRGLLSGSTDGRFFDTGAEKPKFEPPPNVMGASLRTDRLDALVVAHGQLLREQGVEIIELADAAGAREFIDRYERNSTDHGLRTGRWVLLDEREAPLGEAQESTAAEAAQDAAERDPVLDALASQEEPKSNWGKTLWMGGLSLFLFVGVGGLAWDWTFALLLAIALGVHELGHLVAMRWLGYRDVRILFVPLLGAATMGRQRGAAGWRKVLVALAGPVPSIVAAAAAVFLLQGEPLWLLTPFLLLVLLLNALNLLPLLPFDGGWVANELVFARHPVVEALFRGTTTLLLVGGGYLIGSWFFGALGLFMSLGILPALRQGRLARELRVAGFAARRTAEGALAEDSTLAVAEAVRARRSHQAPPDIVALDVNKIVERLESRPPGVIATLGLLAIHAGAFLLALVAALSLWR